MQQHPQLLRRPLPPKLPPVSLYRKKIHKAKTVESKPHHKKFTVETESHHIKFTVETEPHHIKFTGETEPHDVKFIDETTPYCLRFIKDEATSVKTDKISFPYTVSRDQPQPTLTILNIFFDYFEQEKATISTLQRFGKHKHVSSHLSDTTTASVFPSLLSASTQILLKPSSQEVPRKIGKKTIDKKLQDILILTSKWPKPLYVPFSIVDDKFQKVYPDSQPLPRSPDYSQRSPLRDLNAALPSPRSSPTSSKIENQWSARFQPRGLVIGKRMISINQFPSAVSLPAPVLPRKPHQQSLIEALAEKNEKADSVPRPAEVSIERRKIDYVDEHILRGEGFKTVTATRYETLTAMANLAVASCQIYGRNALNLKGFFILNCPDLTPLAFQLVYLNLSFNDLSRFPTEVLCLKNLQVLKLRNNPIKTIPNEIQQLKFLRIFSIAFNFISELPFGLFSLIYLEELDISYNEITSIPNEIHMLRSLVKLNIDGNYLFHLPPGILRLNLIKIHFKNTFTHHRFWRENSLNSPQRLTHICSLFIVQNNIHKTYDVLPAKVQRLLKSTSRCAWCSGPKFGEGFRVIRSCDIFGVSQLPILFHVCSSSCYTALKENSIFLEVLPGKRIPLNLD